MEDMKRETSNEKKNSSNYGLTCTLSNLFSCRLEHTVIFFFLDKITKIRKFRKSCRNYK